MSLLLDGSPGTKGKGLFHGHFSILFKKLIKIYFYLFIWLLWVLVAAHASLVETCELLVVACGI